MDIQALTLANKCPAISRQVDDLLLTDLPNGLVNGLDVVRNSGDVLNGTVVSDDHILHVIVPKTEVDQLAEEPWANDLEFTSQDTACVDVAI